MDEDQPYLCNVLRRFLTMEQSRRCEKYCSSDEACDRGGKCQIFSAYAFHLKHPESDPWVTRGSILEHKENPKS